MNLNILKQAEKTFLENYPGGFNNPQMLILGKKHKMEQLEEFANKSFSTDQFNDTTTILANTEKLVSRSTMVSLFEKPKFRDCIRSLNSKEQSQFTKALFELLHGNEQQGFESLIELLGKYQLAKWSIVTVFKAYYKPQQEVFIKPTTAKLIIEKLGLELIYRPAPTWDFYKKFRTEINQLKKKVNQNLSPNNPAFCGFLMMALG